ncbi:MAG TPA: hypothetical protein VHQ65_03220 [Thermoanaerobaculia bacterium]|nr:hypothetical protein [Thermoanaerobaculia bacterium]
MSLLPLLVLTAAAFVAGLALLVAAGAPIAAGSRPGRRAVRALRDAMSLAPAAIVVGLVALHALLLAYDAVGVPWRRRTLAAGMAALFVAAAAAAWRSTRRRASAAGRAFPALRLPLGWGDLVALAAVAIYAGAAFTRRIGIPDFVYHWGLKAKRYALAGGIDWAWLADPLRFTDHPDYPNLLPGLYAATAHVLGTFDEGGLLLWSAVFFALMVSFARQALALLPGRFAPQAAVATLALAVGMFGIGYDMAGGADWLVALALLAAAPVLLRAPGDGEGRAGHQHLQVGAAAALAAGAKIEGVPLAAVLVTVHLLRVAAPAGPAAGAATGRPAAGPRLGRLLRAAPWVLVPPALGVGPWLAGNLRHGLFQSTNTGTWDADRLGAVAAGLVTTFGTAEWHGLPWLLLLLPVLVAVRRTRALAAVLALQLVLYVGIYLTAPVDTRFYVLSSFPRLAFHLLPPLLVALAVLLVPPRDGGAAEAS